MPRVIFKLMWERIQKKQNIIAFVKNMAKTGRYYWVMTDFVVKENEKGQVTNTKHYVNQHLEKLYKKSFLCIRD